MIDSLVALGRRLDTPLVICLAAAWLAIAAAVWRETARDQQWRDRPLAAQVNGRPERCLACHADVTGLAPAHDPEALGCSSCHLGDPFAFDEDRAHAGMERFPGDLATATESCGQAACHSEAVHHVTGSLMNTGRGMISVDRFCFGEQAGPDSALTFADLAREKAPTPAADHLRRLCASCHLATRRDDHALDRFTRGGGCAACHLAEPAPYRDPNRHRRLTVAVDSERCFGCHSRSGRIALSYHGLAEVAPGQPFDVQLYDGRPARRVEPDVHAAAGMGCIDCHTRAEVMGDGLDHDHKEEAIEIACIDCHPTTPTVAAPLTEDDAITRRLVALRGWEEQSVSRTRKGTPLYFLTMETDGRVTVRSRGPEERRWIAGPTPDDPDHSLAGHERLACQACHSRRAPLCTGCHTSYAPDETQWDHLAGRERPGRWREKPGPIEYGPPLLGVADDGRIFPFIPGMPLRVQTGPDLPWLEDSYFAPLAPHTTTRAARPCSACHRDGATLGLGPGALDYVGAAWHFTPAPASGDFDLRWTTPEGQAVGRATRGAARPFTAEEIDATLTVGACLPCHKQADDPLYESFRGGLDRWREGAARRCDLPATETSDPGVDKSTIIIEITNQASITQQNKRTSGEFRIP